MKSEDLLQILGDVAEEQILEAKRTHQPRRWPWLALAACIAALVGIIFWIPQNTGTTVSVGGILRNYKNIALADSEIALIWPWAYQTPAERYPRILIHQQPYHCRGYKISASLLGNALGTWNALGYDGYTETEHTLPCPVYQITGVSSEALIAVQLEDGFYVFLHSEYQPSSDLGTVLNAYSLDQHLKLNRFAVYAEGDLQGYYALENDGPLWDILFSCADAALMPEELWSLGERNHISFTVTSEALGIYKRVFRITSDGFLCTNILDYGYTFHIGTDAAAQIIEYATGNAVETPAEPDTQTLSGQVVGIENGYILVDDSILCTDQSNGMIFRVPTADLRIRRYLEMDLLSTGDLVRISFMGEIDEAAGNLVPGASTISKAILSDGNLLIPE